MQRTKKFTISLLISFAIFSVLISPNFSSAASLFPLVPCKNTVSPIKTTQTTTVDAKGNSTTQNVDTVTITEPCNFTAFMLLIHNVINFILFALALPIAALMFIYAGFLLITAQGGEAKGKAKNIFMNAVIGLIIAFACFIIIKVILNTLGYQGAWIGF